MKKKKSLRKHIGIKNLGLLGGLEKSADEGKLDRQLPFIGDSRALDPKPVPATQPILTTAQVRSATTPEVATIGPAVSATGPVKGKFTYFLSLETMTKFDDYVWRTRGNKSKIIESLVVEFLQKAGVGETEIKEVIKKAAK